jgi:hypothetical protein
MLSLSLFVIGIASGLSLLVLTKVNAQSTPSNQCHQTLGASIPGGVLNNVDYIKVNGVKISQLEILANNQKSSKALAQEISKVPNVQAKIVRKDFMGANGPIRLLIQSPQVINFELVGQGGVITGLKGWNKRVLAKKCPR